jgi:hypothetical protein
VLSAPARPLLFPPRKTAFTACRKSILYGNFVPVKRFASRETRIRKVLFAVVGAVPSESQRERITTRTRPPQAPARSTRTGENKFAIIPIFANIAAPNRAENGAPTMPSDALKQCPSSMEQCTSRARASSSVTVHQRWIVAQWSRWNIEHAHRAWSSGPPGRPPKASESHFTFPSRTFSSSGFGSVPARSAWRC